MRWRQDIFDEDGRSTPSAWPRSESGALAEVPPGALRAPVAALPTLERLVLVLRDVERLGPEEATAALGVATPAQRALLHRARTGVLRQIGSGRRRDAPATRCERRGEA